jgi:hypothetical protein
VVVEPLGRFLWALSDVFAWVSEPVGDWLIQAAYETDPANRFLVAVAHAVDGPRRFLCRLGWLFMPPDRADG